MIDVPFSCRWDESSSTVHVGGELDSPGVAQLRQTLRLVSRRSVVVDLQQVTYLPSAAITALVGARRAATAAGGSLELVAGAGSIASRVLTVVALPHRAP